MRHEPGFHGDPAGAGFRYQQRPPICQRVIALEQRGIRGLSPRLDRIAAVGEHADRIGGHQELAGVPRRGALRFREGEPREIPHVLPANAEVGVDAGRVHAGAETGKPSRTCRAIGLLPAFVVDPRRRRLEVRRTRVADQAHVGYFLMLAWCSLSVLA